MQTLKLISVKTSLLWFACAVQNHCISPCILPPTVTISKTTGMLFPIFSLCLCFPATIPYSIASLLLFPTVLLPCHYSLHYCLFQFIFVKIDNLLVLDKLHNQFCGIHCSFNINMLVWCAIQGMRSILRYNFISKALLFLSNLHSTVISTHATTRNVHVRKVSC